MFGRQGLCKSAEHLRTGFASVMASVGGAQSCLWLAERSLHAGQEMQNLCGSGAGGRWLRTSQLFTCHLEAGPD